VTLLSTDVSQTAPVHASRTLVAKDRDTLLDQLDRISRAFCGGESIAPTTLKANLIESSIASFRRDHPIRYEIYREALRQEHKGKDAQGVSPELLARLKELNHLDEYIARHQSGIDKTLRPQQMEVFKKLRESIERGDRSGYIKLPTGSGKTVIFSEFVEALGGRSLVVVPTNQLVEQTVERLKQFAGDMRVTSYDKNGKDPTGDVVVITYDSLIDAYDAGAISPESFNAVILDEAHRALGPRRQEILSHFKAECLTIGFTATPEFNEEKSLRNLVGEPIYQMSLKEAVEGGMLCPTRWIPVKTQANLSKVTITSSGQYDEESLEAAVNTKAMNQAAAGVFGKYFAGKTGVAFCVGIQHAKDVAKEFNAKGIPAEATWGGDPDLEAKLAKLKSGEIKMLCNAKLLIEGFDQDGISVCLNLAPTRSIVNAEQRGGRVLRLSEADPFKQAFVVDFIPRDTPADKMPVTFAQVMGGVALGEVAPLPLEAKEGAGEGRMPLPRIEGVEVFLDKVEVAAFLNQKGILLSGSAPEGWIPIHTLYEHFPDIAPGLVPLLARDLAHGDDGQFIQHFKTGGELGNICEHVSAELVTELTESLDAMPEGAKLLHEVSIPGFSPKKGAELISQIAAEKEFSGELSTLAGQIKIVGPKLLAEAHVRAKTLVQVAPEGWISKSSLIAQHKELMWNEIRFVLEKIIGDDAGLRGKFTDAKTDRETDYFAPQVNEQLPDALAEYALAKNFPPDWLKSKAVSEALGISRDRLYQFAQKLGVEGKEWARMPYTGNFTFFYSPSLVIKIGAEIARELELKKPAPVPIGLAHFLTDKKYPDVKGSKRAKVVESLKAEFPDKTIEPGPKNKGLLVSQEILGAVRESFTVAQLYTEEYQSWGDVQGRHNSVPDCIESQLARHIEENPHAFKRVPYRGGIMLLVTGQVAREVFRVARLQEAKLVGPRR
jgi:superfamily II DNA or RNA helicase